MGWQNFVPLGAGVPFERRRQRGVPLKDVILQLLARIVWKRLQIGTDMLLIITSTGDTLFRFINNDDLERPWTPKGGFYWIFRNFWMQRTFPHWIATRWLETNQDKLRIEIFSIKRRFKQFKSRLHIGSRRPAQAGVKDGYPLPLKIVILPHLSRVAWKRLQIGTDMRLS